MKPNRTCVDCGDSTGNHSLKRPRCWDCARYRNFVSVAATRLVNRALKAGRLVRPNACSRCNQPPAPGDKIQAHHPNYSFPLRVEWLCRSCHIRTHTRERRARQRRQLVGA